MTESIDKNDVLKKIDKALQHVYDICQERARWRMSIPANPDYDSDLILCEALESARQALVPSAERWPIPKGWRVVPEEPTSEMIAANDALESDGVTIQDIWRAMVGAAPVCPMDWSPELQRHIVEAAAADMEKLGHSDVAAMLRRLHAPRSSARDTKERRQIVGDIVELTAVLQGNASALDLLNRVAGAAFAGLDAPASAIRAPTERELLKLLVDYHDNQASGAEAMGVDGSVKYHDRQSAKFKAMLEKLPATEGRSA